MHTFGVFLYHIPNVKKLINHIHQSGKMLKYDEHHNFINRISYHFLQITYLFNVYL